MESLSPPSGRPKRRYRFVIRLFVFLLIIGIAGLLSYYWFLMYYPNSEHVEPDYGGLQKPIYYRGELLKQDAVGEKESLKLPLDFIKDKADPSIVYENASDSVIITTKDKVVRMKTNVLTATVNEKPLQLKFPIVKNGDDLYLPIEPVKQYYGLTILEAADTGNVIVHLQGDNVQWGKAEGGSKGGTAAVRKDPGIKSPILADLQSGEEVMIWSENNQWYYIQRKDGTAGYARKKDIVLDRVETIPTQPESKTFVPWKPIGGKINMTWEHVTTRNPDTAKIGAMPGLNVISPTWFHILDGEGNLKNLADAAYVKWAQSQNYQVWALFSNGFDPKVTTEALATYDKRMKMIKQLLAFAQMYNLQGINIDFENVNLKDKANLTQFVREMTPLLHEQGLVVSMDVTTKSTSENWSMFYDRPALSETIDYMMVMTYDEHWAASPIAGSVASLPWVEKSIIQLLNEEKVPASKLVLGVPYYTRIWTEQTKNGKKEVSSRAVFMETIDKLIKDKGLKPTFSQESGQNYIEYTEDGKVMKVWIEDETSMKARIELVKKYDLAGVASWRRGYETANIWDVIKQTLEKRP
ncbi:glycosyl hydrolase [Paenibacillus hemerocallicola]|uniref:Glycosyl hydrolase n=1 Tax=Paenibacillus hemerocallicola TaxID=1172614 RepID=A0A5C4T209_9BACL|nr:glycosyl hydrolase family 18 protein [Paenibacillus hemerocallicola]TNJ62317.1 glycosyl hydrolase [Paenibacillus hemerocallicola]